MCGYLRRNTDGQTLREYYASIQVPLSWPKVDEAPEEEHFYAAFGGNASRQITGMIIRGEGEAKTVAATWWYDCSEEDGRLVVGSRTTFNARNLVSPYWRGGIRHYRGIAVASAIGEGKAIDGKNVHYLMSSKPGEPILLGTIYRAFPCGLYSCAVITRDSQPGFDKYHDKAFPLMLPNDQDFLQKWLADVPESEPSIAELLAHPKVFNDLTVVRVKTLKGGVPLGEAEFLSAG